MKKILAIIACLGLFSTCKDNNNNVVQPEPKLIFKFKFDPAQERLGSDGLPKAISVGNAAQSPIFNRMSAHYIELTPTAITPVGAGKVVYIAPERTLSNGDKAIEFDQSSFAGNNEMFYSMPLKNAIGSFDFIRVSLAYQNFDIQFRVTNGTNTTDQTGTIASFIGFKTYINNVTVKNQILPVNAAKNQGFWVFENPFTSTPSFGQASATTVPNPLLLTSPIPAGSCLVTGAFKMTTPLIQDKLIITGNETQDIIIEVSLSTNSSFEWTDANGNGKWEPLLNENVVDMGIRGLRPIIK